MDPAHSSIIQPPKPPDPKVASGDIPIPNPRSTQIVDEKQQAIAENVAAVNTVQTITQAETIQSSAAHGQSNDQIRKLGEKIEQAALPEELKAILDERIARLALIRSGAGFTSSTYILEYESTARYVNWIVGLPWNKTSKDSLDLLNARKLLDKTHYGLDQLKQRVIEYMATIMLNIQNNGPDFITRSPILCFVGLAGTGKTTFAKSIADTLGRKFERIPFGGMADSRVLRGQSRYFPDAEPGAIIKRLVHAKTGNPVILLDELDRVTETARSDIMGVLIELLDPEQNVAFTDHYIDYPFNLSKCLFVATANNTTAISTAVLDRLEIIQMPSYIDEEKIAIAKQYVLPKVQSLTGLKADQLSIDDAVWEPIVRPLGYDPGIRGLERLINTMCRKAATKIVSGEAQNIRITPDNIKVFLAE
jgi:ATP-dependent Lon protease